MVLQNNIMFNMSKISLINFARINYIFPPEIVDRQIISPTYYVKILGFILDNKLSFIDQI